LTPFLFACAIACGHKTCPHSGEEILNLKHQIPNKIQKQRSKVKMTNQNAKVSNFLSLRGVFSFLSLRGAEGDEAISGIATP
jgi:hypothetical protein